MIQELINDLHYLNSMGETPDGDGITVNVQLWAERWVARLESDATLINAERYRWLRKNAGAWEVSRDCGEWENCETGEKFKPRVYFTAFSTGYGGMRLDDAIDAAMNGANAPHKPRSEAESA